VGELWPIPCGNGRDRPSPADVAQPARRTTIPLAGSRGRTRPSNPQASTAIRRPAKPFEHTAEELGKAKSVEAAAAGRPGREVNRGRGRGGGHVNRAG